MRCKKCDEGWSFSEEVAPLGIRLHHRCPRCGWVSRRPALAALLLLTLVSCAAWDLDSWAARIAVWTLMYAVVQVVGDLDRLRLEQSGAGKDAPYERW